MTLRTIRETVMAPIVELVLNAEPQDKDRFQKKWSEYIGHWMHCEGPIGLMIPRPTSHAKAVHAMSLRSKEARRGAVKGHAIRLRMSSSDLGWLKYGKAILEEDGLALKKLGHAERDISRMADAVAEWERKRAEGSLGA